MPKLFKPRRARDASTSAELAQQQKMVLRLEKLVSELLMERRGYCLMPPPHLRLHVGAKDSAANFWIQGRDSSREVLRVFGEAPEGEILDWGCGSGRTLYWLHEHEAWKRAYRGCDVDAEAIKWLRKQGMDAVQVCGDDPPLPYRDGQFSGLFSFSVLTHIPPEKHAAWYAELARVLKPGARAYLTMNGEGRGEETAFTAKEREEFARRGRVFADREGHYKGAAIVSRAFTTAALEGLFETEQYLPFGYHNMDVVIARRT